MVDKVSTDTKVLIKTTTASKVTLGVFFYIVGTLGISGFLASMLIPTLSAGSTGDTITTEEGTFFTAATPQNNARSLSQFVASTGTYSSSSPYGASQVEVESTIPNSSNIISITGTRDTGWSDNSWIRTTQNLFRVKPPSSYRGICTTLNDPTRSNHTLETPMTIRDPLTDCANPTANGCGCNTAADCNVAAAGEICADTWLLDEWKSSGANEGGHIRDMRFLWELGTNDWQYEYIAVDRSEARDFGGDYSQYEIEYSDPSIPICGNGVIEAETGEQCDSGNITNNDGDGCNNACQFEYCGDGILQDNVTVSDSDGNPLIFTTWLEKCDYNDPNPNWNSSTHSCTNLCQIQLIAVSPIAGGGCSISPISTGGGSGGGPQSGLPVILLLLMVPVALYTSQRFLKRSY